MQVSQPQGPKGASEQESLAMRLSCLVLIHDLLPHEDDTPGLSTADLQRQLAERGIDLPRRTVNRYLADAADLFWIHFEERRGRAILWKRVHQENLAARIRPLADASMMFHADGSRDQWPILGAGRADDCPDFPSRIRMQED